MIDVEIQIAPGVTVQARPFRDLYLPGGDYRLTSLDDEPLIGWTTDRWLARGSMARGRGLLIVSAADAGGAP